MLHHNNAFGISERAKLVRYWASARGVTQSSVYAGILVNEPGQTAPFNQACALYHGAEAADGEAAWFFCGKSRDTHRTIAERAVSYLGLHGAGDFAACIDAESPVTGRPAAEQRARPDGRDGVHNNNKGGAA